MDKKYVAWISVLAAMVITGALMLSRFGSAVAAWAQDEKDTTTVIIDAGHGGEDGGAVSVSGICESGLNLEIALRLNDFLHLFGIETQMIRTSDISIHTEGNTIAQKKVSDIRNRVSAVENTPNALLVSIHQNHFSEEKYRGAQVFYAETDGSEALAAELQAAIVSQVDSNNHRQCKRAQDVYLMEHVSCSAVLIECGFLSNYAEEQLLRDASYQKKLAAAIGCCIFNYLEVSDEI
ncbi:MAG: N-acetylmuramoyl-L-alanine amidase [Ruminococcaceae bacterium]|nr:N-acetylmuramoyl-L-alanine amidase [Oscillospiraceae bacterium]